MGAINVTFQRGDLDVSLTDVINKMTMEEYNAFLEDAEGAGHIDAEDFIGNKAKLVEQLPNFDKTLK